MKILLTRMVFIIAFLLVTVDQSLVAKTINKEYCYSAYHLQQQLKLNVTFDEIVEKQNISMDMDIHVREIPTTKLFLTGDSAKNGGILSRNIRSFVMLARANSSKVNGVVTELSERYEHPFLVYVNAESGEVVDLKSTVNDQSVINEYLSFFDLFQYTTQNGRYQYRNGNGFYLAEIQKLNRTVGEITKKNTGYIKAGNKLEVKNSQQSIVLDNSQTECFYQSSEVIESFKTTLSKKAYVEGDTNATVVLDEKQSLPENHFFFGLTEQMDLWPSFERVEQISSEQALIRISDLIKTLSSLRKNKAEFLSAMRTDKAVWSFLADYMLANNLDEALSYTIFWALDRINTTESVSTLARISVSGLQRQLSYRAILALSSTSAPLDLESFELVKNYVLEMSQLESNTQESLLLVRVLGALAERQSVNFPVKSNEIKQFLYSQVDGSSDKFIASVMDAIGNLKGSIDENGVDVLMNGVNSNSEIVKQSALQALVKIPYNRDYSEHYIAQLVSENHPKTKGRIIELLGNSPKTDSLIKKQLLSIVSQSSDLTHRQKSLSSLRKIDYRFQVDDVDVLKSQLRRESDKTNQKLLAGLILKSRRQ